MKYYTGVGSAKEARILNRTLHAQGLRCCHCCFQILPKTQEYFHVKCGEQLNSLCKPCSALKARRIKLEQKSDPKRYCARLVTGVKARAKEQSVPFSLTGDYLYQLLVKQDHRCYYTGQGLDFTLENEDTRTPHRLFPSLDRLTPSEGYVTGNVCWCLYYVNRMKNDLTAEEFLNLCKEVTESFTRG